MATFTDYTRTSENLQKHSKVTYLELRFDQKLMWKTYFQAKRRQFELKIENVLINTQKT